MVLPEVQNVKRESEKGATLVMALLMTSLLLTGCIALLTGASFTAANATDAVAEQQAYNAAESGIQTAINILRRNTTPNVLIDSSRPANHQNNKIDFGRAIELTTSNAPTDTSTEPRLSRWLNYDYTPNGATIPDRVSLTPSYDPQTGSAFSITVHDPDNPTKIINVTTSASIGGGGDSKTFLGVPGFATIKYNAVTTGNVSVTTRDIGINLGSFTITSFLAGGTVTTDTPFVITVRMTAPFPALIKVRGVIKAGTITNSSVGNVKFVLDSPISNLAGSLISFPLTTITPNAPNVNGGKTDLSVRITLAQPRRLVIRSIGYGPRGARKVFEAIVKRDNFDGLLPATVNLVGSLSGSLFKSSTIPSQEVVYSGSEAASLAKIPPIGTINSGSGGLLTDLLGNLTGALCVNCSVNGKPADVETDETPDFLKTAANLDNYIKEQRDLAKASGRYFSGGVAPDSFGDNSQGTGLTFVDGNTKLSGSGGGLLVVTGKLTLDSAFDFNGIILVTGPDGVLRNGGGTGNLQGNLIVAPYNISNVAGGFLPPKYDITGGTASRILYSATNLLFGSNNYNTVLVSVGEKVENF